MSRKLSTIDELNDDLLDAIFKGLPLSVLLQCKGVNQRFFRVISNKNFLHKPFEEHKVFLLFQFRSSLNYDKKMLFSISSTNKTNILKGSNFLPLSWSQDRDQVRVKATHYDLLLCATQSYCYIHYFVCNPFTKQCVTLPPLPRSHAQELSRVGFIFDRFRSRFRVVHIPIVCFKYVTTFKVNMFSSETCEWSVSHVSIPFKILMSNSCSKNILVYNDKFVWWIEGYGFLVCDPFNGLKANWQKINLNIPIYYFDLTKKHDINNGICNGRVKILEFSKTDSQFDIYELVNFEEGTWSRSIYSFGGIDMMNMNLLGLDPHSDSVLYLSSKAGIFLYDYKKRKLECMYTAARDEDIYAWGNPMSLVLPESSPTPVPTLNAHKFSG